MKVIPQIMLTGMLLACLAPAEALAVQVDTAGPSGPNQAATIDPKEDEGVAPEEELITRVYQLGGLEHKVPSFDEGATLLPIALSGLRGTLHEQEPATEAIINTFTNTYWKELEFEGRWLEYDETYRVSMRASQEMHDNFVAMVAFYTRCLDASIPMQVDIVRYAKGDLVTMSLTPGKSLLLDDVDAWVEEFRKKGQVETLLLSVPPGAVGTFQQQSVKTLTAGVDMEIAQGVGMPYGVPVDYRSGTWGTVLATPVSGGLELDLHWMVSDDPIVRAHKLDLVGMIGSEHRSIDTVTLGGAVDLTDQRAVAGTTSMFLRDGHAGLSFFYDGERELCTTLVLRRLESPSAPVWFETTGKHQAKIFLTPAAHFQNRELSWEFGEITEHHPFRYSLRDGRGLLNLYRGNSDGAEQLVADRNDRLVEVWTEVGQLLMRTNTYDREAYDVQVAEIDRLAKRLTHPSPPSQNYRVEISVNQGGAVPGPAEPHRAVRACPARVAGTGAQRAVPAGRANRRVLWALHAGPTHESGGPHGGLARPTGERIGDARSN